MFFCTKRCLILKFFYNPYKVVSLFWFNHTIYKFGKLIKFVKMVALRFPKCTYVVFFAYLLFFIGIAYHGLAYTTEETGLCLVINNSNV